MAATRWVATWSALSLSRSGGPDAAVVGGHRKRRFLQCRDSLEIEIASMKLFKIVATDGKLERHRTVCIARVYGDRRSDIASEQQYAMRLIAVPVVEEKSIRPGGSVNDRVTRSSSRTSPVSRCPDPSLPASCANSDCLRTRVRRD